jgi:AbrB family looped-hinge helix DNA binding protein
MPAAKLTSKGQVTVPKGVREALGLRTGDVIEFVPEGGEFRLRKRIAQSRLERWVGFLRDHRGAEVDEIVEELRGR